MRRLWLLVPRPTATVLPFRSATDRIGEFALTRMAITVAGRCRCADIDEVAPGRL